MCDCMMCDILFLSECRSQLLSIAKRMKAAGGENKPLMRCENRIELFSFSKMCYRFREEEGKDRPFKVMC